MAEEIQKKLQTELDNFKSVQKDHHKALSTRQQLDIQLNENHIVKKELDILKSDAEVYKLIGPVLVRVEVSEAKQNVGKRLEYINKELQRMDDLIGSLDKKQDTLRESLQKLQQQFQQAQLKAAAKA